jgi:hypothetical protein
MNLKTTLAAALLATTAAGSAFADSIPYGNVGTANPVTYTFTAATTGDISAYYLGSTAGYTEYLGLLVNGTDSGVTGLQNHGALPAETAVGQQLDFGHVNAGDVLTFYTYVSDIGTAWYSTVALNTDGVNHVYSTSYTGPDGPAGTYVAFEDLAGGGDLNYHDETFVFTNVASTPSIPEPANMALLMAGCGLVGCMARRRRS